MGQLDLFPGPRKRRKKSRLYCIWCSMKERCASPNNHAYARYGGRGIKVCERWRNSFAAFRDDMGPRPDRHSIDRIDNDGDYCPENCIWADYKTQGRNKRSNRSITHNGETKLLVEWAEESGVGIKALWRRLELGWKFEDAIGLPKRRAVKAPIPIEDKDRVKVLLETHTYAQVADVYGCSASATYLFASRNGLLGRKPGGRR